MRLVERQDAEELVRAPELGVRDGGFDVALVDRGFLRDLPPDLASRLDGLLAELGR